MRPPLSEMTHEDLGNTMTMGFQIFSQALREAFKRRFELDRDGQEDLGYIIKAHDEALKIIQARPSVRRTAEYLVATKAQGQA